MVLPDFDTDIIPEKFDFYGDIGYDYMLEIDEDIYRIEYVLDFYKIKKKHKKLLYNIMANIQSNGNELTKYKDDFAGLMKATDELRKENSELRKQNEKLQNN